MGKTKKKTSSPPAVFYWAMKLYHRSTEMSPNCT